MGTANVFEVHLNEEDSSELLEAVLETLSLLKVLREVHENNPHESDTFRTLGVALDKLDEVHDLIVGLPRAPEK
jgi:hypothetical protein